MYVSDCCGVESNVDHEVCSRCGEHCEIVDADNVAEYDDDGEGYDPIMGDADDYPDTDDAWLDDFMGEEEFA